MWRLSISENVQRYLFVSKHSVHLPNYLRNLSLLNFGFLKRKTRGLTKLLLEKKDTRSYNVLVQQGLWLVVVVTFGSWLVISDDGFVTYLSLFVSVLFA